ncbi:VPLPA-CTERM sorting domain-containing protein [Sulfuriferula sp.]|uniref:VPLPA-CTERM sorting domain-containing protein n=1 Tax=Sulfuriferula sp. TaxID=2025307 RepID=UPI002731B09E|nr:VPLPA-CTERM sorting domain-containing protein [Sulfuriferula sp.]MDP2027473.1 VPLPA-CTERM sorting domain-containing protein [Sulfuriferula sp.]
MNTLTLSRVLPFVFAMSLAASAGASNLVTNGDFETGDFTAWTQSGVLTDDGNGNLYYAGVGVYAGQGVGGSYGAYLGPVGSMGYLTQSLATVAGQTYTLSWALDNGETLGFPNQFQVSWNGNLVFDQTNIPQQEFQTYSFNLVATSSITGLQFGFQNDPTFFHLDNVSVDVASNPTPVPVPAALWLLGSGLLGLVGITRRKYVPKP